MPLASSTKASFCDEVEEEADVEGAADEDVSMLLLVEAGGIEEDAVGGGQKGAGKGQGQGISSVTEVL